MAKVVYEKRDRIGYVTLNRPVNSPAQTRAIIRMKSGSVNVASWKERP
jgi:hypothetical protein